MDRGRVSKVEQMEEQLRKLSPAELRLENHISKVLSKLDVDDRNEAMALYHHAIQAKLQREKAQLIGQIRALEQQNTALRRQLGRAS
jgi:hypothetical protein